MMMMTDYGEEEEGEEERELEGNDQERGLMRFSCCELDAMKRCFQRL